jgi:RimJ/RimL family protein N-acetyltransferase
MIRGEKINLRLVYERDLDEVYANIVNLDNRGEYFPQTLTSQTEFKNNFTQTGFWSENFGRFLIVSKENHLLGSIYFFKIAIYSDALELGYILFDPSNYGKGYGTEALKLMTDYLFNTKTLNRIQLAIAPAHEPSIKVAIKIGFEKEGTKQQVLYHQGRHIDLDEYVLLRSKWEIRKIDENNKGKKRS